MSVTKKKGFLSFALVKSEVSPTKLNGNKKDTTPSQYYSYSSYNKATSNQGKYLVKNLDIK
jgi:hypothetical protein